MLLNRLLTVVFAVVASSSALGKPNILFIMSDDHASQAIGTYAGRLAELNPTPNIDQLAKEGMRFDNVFCTNSLCTPSRATILTGQYSQANGVMMLSGMIKPEQQTLATEMKRAGYHTAMVGKWHLGHEPAAFDYYCVLLGQGHYNNPWFRVRGDKPWPKNEVHKGKGRHSSDAVTDVSIDWLENEWDREKPFFLMHHFKAPHDMFINAERYDDYLADVKIPEPDNLYGQPAEGFGSDATRGYGSGLNKDAPWHLGKRLKISDDLEGDEYIAANYQLYLKRYLRCVKGVDDNVKRLVDYLKEIGQLDNTIIIYTSDQGFFLGEHNLMDKRWMYEESMRMPFIVRYPKMVKPGTTNDWLINNADFAPTLLELAGSKATPEMQGHSFIPALKSEDKPGGWREATYYRYWMHMAHSLAVPAHFGIRTERYKLIFFYGSDLKGENKTPPAWEMYDLAYDPHEMKNIYDDPKYADVVKSLKQLLLDARESLNETDKNYPGIQEIIDASWDW